jgi:hypothetical protein
VRLAYWAGQFKTALMRKNQADWKGAWPDPIHFIVQIEFGDFRARAYRIAHITVVAWQEGDWRVLSRLLKAEEQQATEANGDPEKAERVPGWMNLATKVATGNRRRVLEDGPDKMNSDDDECPVMKPDEEKNMYTDEMDPKKGPVKLSASQVAAQKAAAQAQKELRVLPRSQSPANGSSDDYDLSRPEWIWSQTKGIMRKNKAWIRKIAESALALPAPEPQKATPAPESKAAASQKAPADQKPFQRQRPQNQ